MLRLKIVKMGGGLGVIIPKAILQDRGLEKGDYVKVDIIKKVKK